MLTLTLSLILTLSLTLTLDHSSMARSCWPASTAHIVRSVHIGEMRPSPSPCLARVRAGVEGRGRSTGSIRGTGPGPGPGPGRIRVRAAVPLPGDVFARLQVHAVPVDHLGKHLLCVAPPWPRLQVRSEPVRVRVRVGVRDRVRVGG